MWGNTIIFDVDGVVIGTMWGQCFRFSTREDIEEVVVLLWYHFLKHLHLVLGKGFLMEEGCCGRLIANGPQRRRFGGCGLHIQDEGFFAEDHHGSEGFGAHERDVGCGSIRRWNTGWRIVEWKSRIDCWFNRWCTGTRD
jgi:hypothetical protein